MKQVILIIAVVGAIIIAVRGCSSIDDAEKKDAARVSDVVPVNTTAPVAAVPTLEDTLRKTEIRATVFLKMEYGKSREDIDIVAQQWYPAQKMEVVKWRVRDGMAYVYVVTQTRVEGDYSDANNMSVKVVNKYRE